MNILRNAIITSAALVLGVGAVAHASGNSHGDDTRTGYYSQAKSGSHSDDNRAGYYGQVATKSPSVVTAAQAKALHKRVLAKEVKNVYLFGPKAVTIKVGTTIIWSNTSDAEHNVTFDKNSKVNMDFKPNKSVRYTFTKAGTYTYHCEYHPFMKGTVIVHP
jgi:plastocyanin